MNSFGKKRKFTPEEDLIIRRYVQINGLRNWKGATMLLPFRTGKQIRERYINYLSPTVSLQPWSPEEENQLIDLVKKFGNKWAMFVIYFKNRTDISIKNHWVSIRRKIRNNSESLTSSSDVSSSEAEGKKESQIEVEISPPDEDLFQRIEKHKPILSDNEAIHNGMVANDEPVLYGDIFNDDFLEIDWTNSNEQLIF